MLQTTVCSPPKKLLYLSQGNVPSMWAHTFQAMKMAEAFGMLVPDFRFITQARWKDFLRQRFDFESWYGISRPFRIVRLPAARLSGESLGRAVFDRRFDRIAACYAALQRPDYVYTRSPYAGVCCARAGIPTAIEIHTADSDRATKEVQSIAHVPELVAVITVTEFLKQSYVQLGIPESKILVWPDAVDPGHYVISESRKEIRSRLLLPPDRLIAAYAGHFYDHKGVDTILAAARLLPDVNFVLVGGWPEDIERVRRQADGLDNVYLHGFIPNSQIPAYLAAADFLLLPNSGRFPQAFTVSPLKLFEYMAARRPVIATAIPALKGMLVDRRNALLVEPDNPAAFAEGVRTLYRDEALAKRLVESAFEDVQNFTWSRRAQAVLEFMQRQCEPAA